MEILDLYVSTLPSDQNVLDIFAGEWSSRLPADSNLITKPGSAAFFDDDRVKWASQTFGSFNDWNILELGPLEGGHTYMLEKLGARQITAIEANTRAYLKCLCIKEIFNLTRASFKLGDFMTYLASCEDQFDLVLASGVLYHMAAPVSMLELVSKRARRIFIWTHYYDQQVINARPDLRRKFGDPEIIEHDGQRYMSALQHYNKAIGWAGFCGGPKPTSRWLSRDSILEALQRYGFSKVTIGFDHPEHPKGPAFALCAEK